MRLQKTADDFALFKGNARIAVKRYLKAVAGLERYFYGKTGSVSALPLLFYSQMMGQRYTEIQEFAIFPEKFFTAKIR
jgi:hypothetical protein